MHDTIAYHLGDHYNWHQRWAAVTTDVYVPVPVIQSHVIWPKWYTFCMKYSRKSKYQSYLRFRSKMPFSPHLLFWMHPYTRQDPFGFRKPSEPSIQLCLSGKIALKLILSTTCQVSDSLWRPEPHPGPLSLKIAVCPKFASLHKSANCSLMDVFTGEDSAYKSKGCTTIARVGIVCIAPCNY